jgi:uncharacterized protein YxjI
VLDRRTFVVKERVAFMKLSDTYDILDAESGATIGMAQERISGLVKALRILLGKRLLPTTVVIAEHEGGTPLITLSRGATFIRALVSVRDASGKEIGRLRSKFFSIGGGFHVLGQSGDVVGEVKGDLVGWNFQFLAGGRRIATIAKRWAGLGKELFTNADTYVIAIDEPKATSTLVALVLASGIAIDTVFKEQQK